uniref:Fibronectin type-III domain-containing protein n=1 Tax=Acrobeloides nanus TaxID=290746 RepID=A0A914D1Y9_9BILA
MEANHYDIEEDEREHLTETLNGIQAPTIIRVSCREAEISWQELDTSEAAASGGPFPQIDASEFTYEIFVHEGSTNGRVATQHRCDPNGSPSCRLKITRLKPYTDYYVHIRASLPERDLYGYPSAAAYFRTLSTKPETPSPPRILECAPTWMSVSWRAPTSNGSPISSYALQIAKGKNDPFVNVYEGPNEQARVNALEPGSHYRVRVVAHNEYGSSEPSVITHVSTPVSDDQPPQPTSFIKIPPPTVLSVSAKSAKLSWTMNNDYYSAVLEICDMVRGVTYTPINQECYSHSGTSALVNGLQSNREYRFRLAATLYSTSDTHRSDYVSLRTHKDRYENSAYYQSYHNAVLEKERVPTPNHLQRIFDDANTVEIGWEYPGKDFDSVSYVVEAATLADADQQESSLDSSSLPLHELPWRVCYRGTNTMAKIDDSQVCLFRVQSIRKQIMSSWSEPLYIRRYQMRHKKSLQPAKPSACVALKFSNITWCAMDIAWRLQTAMNHVDSTTTDETTNPANITLIYELQRVDKQPIIIYSGDESEYHLENLKPVEHVQVRARAVIVDYEGKRIEGDWSPIAIACTLYHA